jgi:hypothetical protein
MHSCGLAGGAGAGIMLPPSLPAAAAGSTSAGRAGAAARICWLAAASEKACCSALRPRELLPERSSSRSTMRSRRSHAAAQGALDSCVRRVLVWVGVQRKQRMRGHTHTHTCTHTHARTACTLAHTRTWGDMRLSYVAHCCCGCWQLAPQSP